MALTGPLPQYQNGTQEEFSDTPREANHFFTEKGEDSWTVAWDNSRSVNSSTQNPSTQKSQKLYKRTLWRNFLPDMAQWFAAAAIFLAIAILLGKYNGVPEPEWKFAINLNSLVALLTTLMRASMTSVVSEVISQMKWTWFSRPRKLRDLDTFEHAAGSVMGSVNTFLRIRSLHPVLFGSAITILSLGVGPFAQQAIKSVSCDFPTIASGVAAIPVIHRLSGFETFRIGAGQWELDYQTKGAIIHSAANPTTYSSPVSVQCPTGNCTFEANQGITHSSLGLCTRCKDTTDSIVQARNDTKFTIPSNISINNSGWMSGPFMAVGHSDQREARNFANWPEPYNSSAIGVIDVLAFTVYGCKKNEYFNPRTNMTSAKQNCTSTHRRPELTQMSEWLDIISIQCVYYPCMRNYHATVNAGVLEETLISTVPATPDNPTLEDSDVAMNYTAIKQPCYYNSQQYDKSNFSLAPKEDNPIYYNFTPMVQTAVPQHCISTMQTIYTRAMSNFMSISFNETAVGDTKQLQSFGIKNGVIDNLWFVEGSWWLAPLYNQGNASFDTINSVFENIATAYTNHVRNSGILTAAQDSSAMVDPATMIIGQVWRTTLYAKSAWGWLIFPAALILATLVILLTTILISWLDPQQLPIWKSSLLPLLYYGFGKEERDGWDDKGLEMEAEESLEKKSLLGKDELTVLAKDRLVVLRRTERGLSFEMYNKILKYC